MSKLTDTDIIKLAKLSRLAMDEAERKTILKELNSIFDFVDQLQSIDTEGVEPTDQVTGLTNASRQDSISDYGVSKSEMLKNVPQHDDNYVQVPKVL